jgi:hypothetical protein
MKTPDIAQMPIVKRFGVRGAKLYAKIWFSILYLPRGEGESFDALFKIYTTGLAGRSSAKPETVESDFLSWGRG